MSINLFNNKTKQWEKASSLIASSIKVLDAAGNFLSENIEGCLKEIADEIVDIKKDIKYLYDNGGGGGGGGGTGPGPGPDTGAAPVVTCDFKQTQFRTDEIISIPYFVTCINTGKFVAHYIKNNSEKKETIILGDNVWNVGILPKGKYTLKFYIKNNDGLISNITIFNIVVGGLEITSRFNPKLDFSVSQDINLTYTLSTLNNEAVTVKRTLDNKDFLVEQKAGTYIWSLGKLSIGLHTLKLIAESGDNVSNALTYNIIVSDSETLFITTPNFTINSTVDNRISLEYRISMQGHKDFKVYATINGEKQPTMSVKLGTNYWQLGLMPEGTYTIIMYAKTADEVYTSNTITITLNIVASDFEPIPPIVDGLIAWFDANGKNNSQENKGEWKDKSLYNTQAKLNRFNFQSNGWEDGTLIMNGETYVEIDCKPFINNLPTGLTFDIMCRTRNTGDLESRVISCEMPSTPFSGIHVTPFYATVKASGASIQSAYSEDTWTRFTFTIDREVGHMMVYINAVICKVSLLSKSETFIHDGKIYLNCQRLADGTLSHYGSCEVQNIRIYDRALDHTEVLQNHMSDMTPSKQKACYIKNYGDHMPILTFVGNLTGIQENVKVPLHVKYEPQGGPGTGFDLKRCMVSWQGTSSLGYDVKNYRINLFKDNGEIEYLQMKDNWKPDNIFTLKANMMDSTQSHNLSCAIFIPKIYKTKTPAQSADPSLRTTIDGFPFLLYIDDESQPGHKPELIGIYDFNIDKKASVQWGQDQFNNKHLGYIGDSNMNSGSVAFKDPSHEGITEAWEVIHPDIDAKTFHPEMQALIHWVMNTTGGDFRRELPEHFDKDFLIDYFLCALVFGMVDSLGKNMVLRTWDGNIWFPCFYDMDSILGMSNSGTYRFPPNTRLEEYNTSSSELWTRLIENCYPDIFNRYVELRRSWFTYEHIMEIIEGEIISQIGERFYNLDTHHKYLQWGDTYLDMCNGNRLEQIKKWVKERIIYLDTRFMAGENYTTNITIRVAKPGTVTLKFKTYSPIMLTVDFGSLALTQTKLCTPDAFTEFTCNIDSQDREIIVYGAAHIIEIDGLQDFDVTRLLLFGAKRMINLNCSNSPSLYELAIKGNSYLQNINISNCPSLTSSLDLTEFVNLKYFDARNTSITNVAFSEGGALKRVLLDNSKVSSLNLTGQEFLDEISIANCNNLTVFRLENCNRLKKLNAPDTKLESFNILGCQEIESINISRTPTLHTLNIANCPSLLTLNLSGLSNPGFVSLDIKKSMKIQKIDVSRCSNLKKIYFGQGCNSLTYGDFSNSGMAALCFGNLDLNNIMDFASFRMIYSNFENCPNAVQILNLRHTGHNTDGTFRECRNLTTVTGVFAFSGYMSNTFFGCSALHTLPQLDLENVTTLTDTFNGCINLSRNEMIKVFASLKKVDFISGVFSGCKGIQGVLPNNLFQTCTNLVSLYNCFGDCKGLTGSIPEGFFANCSKLEILSGVFSGCSSLTGEIPSDFLSHLPLLSIAENVLTKCTDLTGTIPSVLFQNCTSLTSIKNFFSGCSGLTGVIPNTLLSTNTRLKYVDNLFENCSGITGSIPGTLLTPLTLLLSAQRLFDGCEKLTGSIPTTFFDNNREIINISRCFSGCKKLTGSIPTTLVSNLTKLVDISNLFKNCSLLTGELPRNFLTNNRQLSLANHLFSGCSNLSATIPGDLFTNCPELLEAEGVFYNLAGLTGDIPPALFARTMRLTKLSSLFEGCVSLNSQIPENFIAQCSELVKIDSMFNACGSIIGTIPITFLANNTKLEEVQSLFYGCSRLTGTIPENLLAACPEIKNVSFLFCGTNLTGTIPVGLFNNNSKITNMMSLFHSTVGLTGPIPATLFKYTTHVTNLNSAFRGCNKLTVLPNTLFNTVPNITNVESLFNGCNGLTGNAIPFWNTHSQITNRSGCYRGCTSLSDYSTITADWK